jgi:peptidoglycan/xylan/chitin deacetylase (PgdA/CDA1 family)
MSIWTWAARLAGPIIQKRYNPNAHAGVLYFHRVLRTPSSLYPDDPTVDELDRLIACLKQCFLLVRADELAADPGDTKPRLALTFDDGYADNITHALPVLDKHQVKGTFFIATDGMAGEGILWHDKVLQCIMQAPGAELCQLPRTAYQGRRTQRTLIAQGMLSDLKHLPHEESREALAELETKFNPEYERFMMTAFEVRRLHDEGHAIGGHTMSHRILTTLNDEEARCEIQGSFDALQRVTGEPPLLFCYPNGEPEVDFTEKHKGMVVDAGYTLAFSTRDGGVNPYSDLLSINRFLPFRRHPLLRTLSAMKIAGEA